jgi:hypothetical protein
VQFVYDVELPDHNLFTLRRHKKELLTVYKRRSIDKYISMPISANVEGSQELVYFRRLTCQQLRRLCGPVAVSVLVYWAMWANSQITHDSEQKLIRNPTVGEYLNPKGHCDMKPIIASNPLVFKEQNCFAGPKRILNTRCGTQASSYVWAYH